MHSPSPPLCTVLPVPQARPTNMAPHSFLLRFVPLCKIRPNSCASNEVHFRKVEFARCQLTFFGKGLRYRLGFHGANNRHGIRLHGSLTTKAMTKAKAKVPRVRHGSHQTPKEKVSPELNPSCLELGVRKKVFPFYAVFETPSYAAPLCRMPLRGVPPQSRCTFGFSVPICI